MSAISRDSARRPGGGRTTCSSGRPYGGPKPGHRGRALRFAGRQAEARDQLIVAVGVLRADPDSDTVRVDPAAAAEAARTAARHLRRAGDQGMLTFAVGTLVGAAHARR